MLIDWTVKDRAIHEKFDKRYTSTGRDEKPERVQQVYMLSDLKQKRCLKAHALQICCNSPIAPAWLWDWVQQMRSLSRIPQAVSILLGVHSLWQMWCLEGEEDCFSLANQLVDGEWQYFLQTFWARKRLLCPLGWAQTSSQLLQRHKLSQPIK